MAFEGYQRRDFEIVDYSLYKLKGTNLWNRGPEIDGLERTKYFTCVGAAQTFGCLCERPFPTILQEKLHLKCLNLGYGGAGPKFFLENPRLIEYVNQSELAIIQTMAGRSAGNSIFTPVLYGPGGGCVQRVSDGETLNSLEAYTNLLRDSSLELFRLVIHETREQWLEDYRKLLNLIRVPKIHLWFSKRRPQYKDDYSSLKRVFRDFPHLINERMVNKVNKHCDTYVECSSRRGIPHVLVSRFTGDPIEIDMSKDDPKYKGILSKNIYYPSPEMHEDAARLLSPVLTSMLR